MARGRMVNKKISNSKRVNDLPEQAQLLFTWLIPHLDMNGCFYGSARMVKNLVFPRKKITEKRIESYLKMMESAKNDDGIPLIFRYFSSGEQYIFMPGFIGEQIGLRRDKEQPQYPFNDELIPSEFRQNVGVREVEVEENINKKEENIIFLTNKYGEYKNVFLTDEEYQKLIDKLGEIRAAELIEAMSEGIKMKGYEYKNHFLALLNWDRRGKSKEQDSGGVVYRDVSDDEEEHKRTSRSKLPKKYTRPEDV